MEINHGGYSHENAGMILDCANDIKEHIYIKSDGSLDTHLDFNSKINSATAIMGVLPSEKK